ncbi:MAG: peptidylprolyl isomerase [Candidatus Omnitrophota bacterium]|nr:peptidylprolyl isomerase [Candidatus Omnitrophota bacterium]
MLSILRHKGVSKKVLWFITVIIVLSFGVFGAASGWDSTNSAGKIYGQSVSLRDFERAYMDSRDQALILYGDQLSKLGDRLDLENEAWDRLILSREAKKRGIKVSDAEVAALIAAFPFFQREGRFDRYLYEELVRNPGAFGRKPHDFEEGMRNRLMIKKMLDGVTGPMVIADDEVKQEYARRNEKIRLDYVIINPADFSAGLEASEKEIKEYYDRNAETLRAPATVNVQYVIIALPDKKEAQAFAKALTPSADFVAAAKQAGYEAKESGPFTKDQPLLTFAWSPDLVEKLFAMKAGATTPLLEMPDGWQIARVKEHKDSAVPDLAVIKEAVQKTVIAQKAYAKAQAKAEEVLRSIKESVATGKDFKTSCQALNLDVRQTPEFSHGEYNPALGFAAQLQEASLKLEENNRLTDTVATPQGPAIAYLSSVVKVKDEDFEGEKDNYRQMLSARKRSQILTAFVTRLKLEAKLQSNVKDKIRR